MNTRKRLIFAVTGSMLFAGDVGQNPAAPAAAPAPEVYVFVQNLDRQVGVHRGEWNVYGRFNADGELIADGKQPAFGRGKWFEWMGPIINQFPDAQPCFELHSGRLFKGTMTTAGRFIPDAGSRVTKFEDYRYAPGTPPIWNLPGYFMRRDKLDERRKWLAGFLATHPADAAHSADADVFARRCYAKEKARLDAAVERKK